MEEVHAEINIYGKAYYQMVMTLEPDLAARFRQLEQQSGRNWEYQLKQDRLELQSVPVEKGEGESIIGFSIYPRADEAAAYKYFYERNLEVDDNCELVDISDGQICLEIFPYWADPIVLSEAATDE